VSDIVTRLRTWVHAVDAVSASDLMDEAATVIKVGRCCTSSLRDQIDHLRLTDAERQAIRYMIAAGKFGHRDEALTEEHAATLRGLLERLGGGE
jgi:hypothetical protein